MHRRLTEVSNLKTWKHLMEICFGRSVFTIGEVIIAENSEKTVCKLRRHVWYQVLFSDVYVHRYSTAADYQEHIL